MNDDEEFNWREDTWNQNQIDSLRSLANYTQKFKEPVKLYELSCWPWWARWCTPVRKWYMKRHPEIFWL